MVKTQHPLYLKPRIKQRDRCGEQPMSDFCSFFGSVPVAASPIMIMDWTPASTTPEPEMLPQKPSLPNWTESLGLKRNWVKNWISNNPSWVSSLGLVCYENMQRLSFHQKLSGFFPKERFFLFLMQSWCLCKVGTRRYWSNKESVGGKNSDCYNGSKCGISESIEWQRRTKTIWSYAVVHVGKPEQSTCKGVKSSRKVLVDWPVPKLPCSLCPSGVEALIGLNRISGVLGKSESTSSIFLVKKISSISEPGQLIREGIQKKHIFLGLWPKLRTPPTLHTV